MNLGIRDVPCGRCCAGYGSFHACESDGFCPCDQRGFHKTLAKRIDELERECRVGPYAEREAG